MRPESIELTVNTAPESKAYVIFVGVPTFGMVSIQWHAHMLALQHPLNRSVAYANAVGMEVGQARNVLVQQALAWTNKAGHTVSHVFFVDDDVLIPPYALSVLLARQQPIVSGLYYAKTPAPQPLVLRGPYEGVAETLPRNALVPCHAHGMGCTLIETDVFRAVFERGLPAVGGIPQWFATERGVTESPGQRPSFEFRTEDVHFLDLARACGYQPMVDTGVFGFHWAAEERRGYPLHLWEEYQRTGQVTIGAEVAA